MPLGQLWLRRQRSRPGHRRECVSRRTSVPLYARGGHAGFELFARASASSSRGLAINNSGQVTGWSSAGEGFYPAFRYTDGVGIEYLRAFGRDQDSIGSAINNSGQVAGVRFTSNGDCDEGPCVPTAFRYTDGIGMQDLGVLPSYGLGINDAGDVVGGFVGGQARPFLYTDALGMVDLNTLIAPDSGWVLREARDINNRGQITGTGLFNGEERAYVLTPVPEPGALGLLAIGLLAVVALRSVKSSATPARD